MASLAPAKAEANVKMAFDAAEKYFGLEQFLTFAEFSKLDHKSMFVYVSECTFSPSSVGVLPRLVTLDIPLVWLVPSAVRK